MKILVINAGSSSIKFRLVDNLAFFPIAEGVLDRIGSKQSRVSYVLYTPKSPHKKLEEQRFIKNFDEGFQLLLDLLRHRTLINGSNDLAAIGHRVVHGGERFKQPTLITGRVIDAIREMIPLAPTHNPINLKGIEICRDSFPATSQVAVFDTAFHQTMPAKAYRYPLAKSLCADNKIRRYGFHGTSHHFVAHCAADLLDHPLSRLNLITLHLGNGASATAIQGGRSIDTSMGMTPLEGLMMGTRSGDIDPAVIFYLAHTTGLDLDEIDNLLNQQSGLFGVCESSDMREIQQRADRGDKTARLAIEMYCYRIKKYIGAYFAILGHLDALVFTAGIGENSPTVRLQVCQGLENLGIHIDPKKNIGPIDSATAIQTDASPVAILVIPTDEETEIALQTQACIQPDSDSQQLTNFDYTFHASIFGET